MAMKSAFASMLALAVALTACASKNARNPSASQQIASYPVADPDARLPRMRIRDWAAVNDETIIITATDGTRYRAETFGPCLGLNFTNRLAFESRGGFEQIDRFSSVVLGDGTRCQFRSFGRLKAPESKALDDYEKAGEKSGDQSGETSGGKPAGTPDDKPAGASGDKSDATTASSPK
jgi:hypothetical protein